MEWAQEQPLGALGHLPWPGSCRDTPEGMEVGWLVTKAECGGISGLGGAVVGSLLGVLSVGMFPPPAGPSGVTATGLWCLADLG